MADHPHNLSCRIIVVFPNVLVPYAKSRAISSCQYIDSTVSNPCFHFYYILSVILSSFIIVGDFSSVFIIASNNHMLFFYVRLLRVQRDFNNIISHQYIYSFSKYEIFDKVFASVTFSLPQALLKLAISFPTKFFFYSIFER